MQNEFIFQRNILLFGGLSYSCHIKKEKKLLYLQIDYKANITEAHPNEIIPIFKEIYKNTSG